jgi:hypothetical protein
VQSVCGAAGCASSAKASVMSSHSSGQNGQVQFVSVVWVRCAVVTGSGAFDEVEDASMVVRSCKVHADPDLYVPVTVAGAHGA